MVESSEDNSQTRWSSSLPTSSMVSRMSFAISSMLKSSSALRRFPILSKPMTKKFCEISSAAPLLLDDYYCITRFISNTKSKVEEEKGEKKMRLEAIRKNTGSWENDVHHHHHYFSSFSYTSSHTFPLTSPSTYYIVFQPEISFSPSHSPLPAAATLFQQLFQNCGNSGVVKIASSSSSSSCGQNEKDELLNFLPHPQLLRERLSSLGEGRTLVSAVHEVQRLYVNLECQRKISLLLSFFLRFSFNLRHHFEVEEKNDFYDGDDDKSDDSEKEKRFFSADYSPDNYNKNENEMVNKREKEKESLRLCLLHVFRALDFMVNEHRGKRTTCGFWENPKLPKSSHRKDWGNSEEEKR